MGSHPPLVVYIPRAHIHSLWCSLGVWLIYHSGVLWRNDETSIFIFDALESRRFDGVDELKEWWWDDSHSELTDLLGDILDGYFKLCRLVMVLLYAPPLYVPGRRVPCGTCSSVRALPTPWTGPRAC